MKRLLIFLSAFGLVQASPYLTCKVGKRTLKRNEKLVINMVRTDKCSSFDGQMYIEECRLPGKNMAISMSESSDKVIDDVAHVYRCAEYGFEGVTITHTAIVDLNLRPVKNEGTAPISGVCNKGSQMWLPNQQWDDGDFVKRCNPDTLKVEVIACLSHRGTFVPTQSNRTTERFDDAIGHVVSVTECTVDRETTYLKQTIHIRPVTDFEGCVARINSENVGVKVGEDRIIGETHLQCAKNDIFRMNIACWGQKGDYNTRIEMGETTALEGRELVCNATREGGARLEPVNFGSEPNCDGRRLNATWEKDSNELSCQLIEGVATVKVIACVNPSPSRQRGQRYRIPVGNIDYMFPRGDFKCVLVNGVGKLEYVPKTCEGGKRKRDEEWTEEGFLKRCVPERRYTDSDLVITIIKACLSGEISIPVGDQLDVANQTCSCTRLDTFPEGRESDFPPLKAALECRAKATNQINSASSETETPVISPTMTTTTDGRRVSTCANGRKEGEQWEELGFIQACEKPAAFGGKMAVVMKACVYEKVVIPVGKWSKVPSGDCQCNRFDMLPEGSPVLYAAVSCKGTVEEYIPSSTTTTSKTSTTTSGRRVLTCSSGKREGQQWKEDLFIKACEKDRFYPFGRGRLIEVIKACVYEKVVIPIGKSGKVPSGTCDCVRTDKRLAGSARIAEIHCVDNGLINYPDSSTTTTTKSPKTSTTRPTEVGKQCPQDLKVGEGRTENGVRRVCNKDRVLEATICFIPDYEAREDRALFFGKIYRGTQQYSCERRGEFDAELVVKSFSQLCEEGDTSVGAWIDGAILRDCVRSGSKSIVYARLCILGDDRLIEIGGNVTDEFETWLCTRVGEYDAKIEWDTSRTDKQYFMTPGTCKNGKIVGDEWTQRGVRRACRSASTKINGGLPDIVDLGCVMPNGALVVVGGSATWEEAGVTTTLYCEAGKQGWGAAARYGQKEVRECDNGRFEGETWQESNVLRTCKEVDDKMAVVAIHCVFGNETVEVGKIRQTSDSSSIECIRLGEYDAVAVIDIFPPFPQCENGKKINDEWTGFKNVRYSCRLRNKRPTVIALGCVVSNGTLLAVGESLTKTEVVQPGEDRNLFSYCLKKGEDDAELSLSEYGERKDDEKSSCGENTEYGAIWTSKHFLKKCKVTSDNYLSAVTIGCVTIKETHMLEGQYLVEDDHDIRCSRNEDGKLEMHYSFVLTEK